MTLLKELDTPNMEALNFNKKSYTSYNTAVSMLQALSDTIDNNVTKQILESPVLTIMTDESTDMVVHHKLCIMARIVSPRMYPTTLFLTDLKISSATGVGIFEEIKKHLTDRGIEMKQVTGLGTDGASVMTGKKEGLTGHFLRVNPHITNTHCAAHRVALCTQQAAESIPAMKHYQQIMESIFYYFKKSPKRCDTIEAVQKLFDEPTLKYIEIHQVRWLSFYKAMETVYQTLDSLLTFFSTQVNDPKAAGLKKKIGDQFFIQMTYALMDILQPIMKLNLFFQKKVLDIALVQVEVNACIADLENMKANRDPEAEKPTFSQELEKVLVEGQFKGHAIPQSKFSFTSAREKFIQLLIDNINARFPDKHLMTSFGVLGLRPVTFLNEEELNTRGDESIQVLCEHFGKERVHCYKLDGVNQESKSETIIDAESTKQEWVKIKQVVKAHQYPRISTAMIWNLIAQYHREDFPNLIKLAALALAHPVHTSDCERAFSAQNAVVTPLRNRISGDHCEQLMRVMLGGSRLEEFDFNEAFMAWKNAKTRKIFSRK